VPTEATIGRVITELAGELDGTYARRDPGVLICNECVNLCNQIITDEIARRDDSARSGAVPATDAPPAMKVRNELSERVPRQDGPRSWRPPKRRPNGTVKRHVAALRERGVSWARASVKRWAWHASQLGSGSPARSSRSARSMTSRSAAPNSPRANERRMRNDGSYVPLPTTKHARPT